MIGRAPIFLFAAALAVTACGEQADRSGVSAEAPMAADRATDESGGEASEAPAPQIAYSYGFEYRLPAGRIDDAQRAHIALCDSLGPARCRIENMEQSSGEGDFGTAALALRVEAAIARQFADRLDQAVFERDGETSGRTITAEDLSRQIVDTEARIRAKQALADRLLAMLESRDGSVGDLVAAERAYAEAQEELDAARTWLAQMQRRVSMSEVNIRYYSASRQDGFLAPIRSALDNAGDMLGTSIGTGIALLVVLLPWLLGLALIVWFYRRYRAKRAGKDALEDPHDGEDVVEDTGETNAN